MRGKRRQKEHDEFVSKLRSDLHKLQRCANIIALQELAPSWFEDAKKLLDAPEDWNSIYDERCKCAIVYNRVWERTSWSCDLLFPSLKDRQNPYRCWRRMLMVILFLSLI